MSDETRSGAELFPPLPTETEGTPRAFAAGEAVEDTYRIILETQCGATDDSQAVEQYNGALGVTRAFVDAHQGAVGQLQWNTNLAARYTNPGNVSGVRWCTGTLISDSLFLTAGHCFDRDADGWSLPRVNGTTNVISSADIATNMHVNFNFQVDANGNMRQEQSFAVTELVEYRFGGKDYAIVRLAGNPRQTFGIGLVATSDPPQNDMLCIIGHPSGVPKRIEAGPNTGLAGDQIRYNDIDTLGGNSGSGIWHSPHGNIGGVHTNGGCTAMGTGFNFGMRISSLLAVSPTLQSLTFYAPAVFAEHSGKVLDVSGVSVADGARVVQWDFHGGGNQRFRPELLADGTFRLIADHSGKVLDVEGASTANGARIIQWPWQGGANQRFRLEPVGNGYYRLVAQHSGRVVDVSGVSMDAGAEMVQWDWWGGGNQRFRFLSGCLFAQHSGKVLDVSGISTADGAPIIQWDYHGGGNQVLRLQPLGDGWYRIYADHSGKVLDVEGASTANGARLIQWPWHGGANQRFRVDAVGGGYFRLVAQHSGKVVDVSGISTASGAQIVQWDWWGGANQRFRLFSTPFLAQHSGMVLDVQGASTDAGARLLQWPLHGGANQRFRPEPLGGGVYRIVADHSGKVLDVEGVSTANGAPIQQWPWHGGNNQRFRIEPVGGGFYRVVAVHSGKVLDVSGISTTAGAQIVQWDWLGGNNQRWRF
jgi:V8-like Glu-specific endopeptidase